jgi:putative DNA primase/helicase
MQKLITKIPNLGSVGGDEKPGGRMTMQACRAYSDPTPRTVPAELRKLRQWVGWEYARGKKRPLDPATGEGARTTDPETWGTFSEAAALFEQVGFVFNEDDPYCGIDLDDCLDPRTGEVRPAAWDVVVALDSYTEVSPSGTGLKVWVRATKPGTRCSTRNTPWGGKIEVYDQGRFFAVTGRVVRERPIRDAQGAVDGLHERFLGQEERQAVVTPLRRPSSGRTALSDDEVRAKARDCRQTGARFAELHDNGSSVVPVGARSEADYFFCRRLAYWTGGDADQMKRLFRLSDLARGKYTEKGHQAEDYLDRTVERAIRDCKIFYDPSEGERMREKVREVVRHHRERLGRSDLTGSRGAVLEELLRIAEEVGSLQKRGVRFNANQEVIAEAVGISQKTVSRIIKALREDEWIKRTEKGSKKRGRNSTYLLPTIGGTEKKKWNGI